MPLTGTHLIETSRFKPSIFDFVAQESLNNLLHPSFKKIIDYLAARDERLRPLAKRYDEVFCICSLLLQYHYLRHYGGTFSERFYDLIRVPLARSLGGGGLRTKEILLSLLFSIIGPYARRKLNEKVNQILFDILPDQPEGRKKRFLKAVVAFNNLLNISLTSLSFIQYLRYMSGKTDVISPSLWASGVRLDYAPPEASQRDSLSLRNFLPNILQHGLELTSFFIQFCHSWSNDNITAFGALPVPPPPKISKAGREFAGICPLCRKKRTTDTVLRVSGFVFCFECILNYVEANGKCPVTALPAQAQDLTILYPT